MGESDTVAEEVEADLDTSAMWKGIGVAVFLAMLFWGIISAAFLL